MLLNPGSAAALALVDQQVTPPLDWRPQKPSMPPAICVTLPTLVMSTGRGPKFAPQQATVPLARTAQLSLPYRATSTALEMFAAKTGATNAASVLPLPSCPLELSPQQLTTPPLTRTLQRCVDANEVPPRGARPARQAREQPSPLTVLPSSQVSPMPACTMPSPQRGALQTPAVHRLLPPLTSEQSALA
jgi:hypothetical protein